MVSARMDAGDAVRGGKIRRLTRCKKLTGGSGWGRLRTMPDGAKAADGVKHLNIASFARCQTVA